MALSPTLRGGLADHPSAEAFAREVLRVHIRYADLVARHRLCPFLRDVETGFGAFCVMLDHEPDVERVVAFVCEAGRDVGHVVYPLARPLPTVFERFSNAVGERLREVLADRPVLAAFHPDLVGDASAPHRLIGLLRRAPDPFVQFVPAGLHEGGTILAGVAAPPAADPAEANFAKLKGPLLDEVLAEMADIRADRDKSYAPFLPSFTR
jgi:hypothetical protein